MSRCPYCGSRHLFLSRSGNRALPFPMRILFIYVRCYSCLRRKLTLRGWLFGHADPPKWTEAA
jgi:hypothetical protein